MLLFYPYSLIFLAISFLSIFSAHADPIIWQYVTEYPIEESEDGVKVIVNKGEDEATTNPRQMIRQEEPEEEDKIEERSELLLGEIRNITDEKKMEKEEEQKIETVDVEDEEGGSEEKKEEEETDDEEGNDGRKEMKMKEGNQTDDEEEEVKDGRKGMNMEGNTTDDEKGTNEGGIEEMGTVMKEGDKTGEEERNDGRKGMKEDNEEGNDVRKGMKIKMEGNKTEDEVGNGSEKTHTDSETINTTMVYGSITSKTTIESQQREQQKENETAISEDNLLDDMKLEDENWKTKIDEIEVVEDDEEEEGEGDADGLEGTTPASEPNKTKNGDSERGGSDFGSGFGPPDEEKDRPHPPFRPLFPTTLPATMRTTIPTTTMTTTDASMTELERTADRWMGAAGPKGEKGDTGAPGTCALECPMPPPGPPGLPGPPGPPGESPILTESDIRRIAEWPGVKGEKGERGSRREEDEEGQEVMLLNGQRGAGAGGYESGERTHAEKGQKGDKGDRGMPGAPGRPGTPAQQPQQQTQQRSPIAATVSVYQTALELLAGTPQCPVGTLAFALSTQQLFLRVHSGWRQVLLDKTVTTDPQQLQQQQQQQSSTSAHSVVLDSAMDPELSRLAYWLALDEPNGSREDYDESKGGPGAEGAAFDGLIPPPAIPIPPTPEAQPWRARWPPRDLKVNEERELERQITAETEPDRTVPRHKDRVIHLMALNEPLSGNFGGVRGADLECYRQARQTGFSTTFRAFLSSRVQDLNKIVHADDRRHTPVVNLLGERLFDSWHAVFDGGAHAHVPLYSFNRHDVFSHWDWTDRWLWHGSSSDGLRSLAYCSEWRSSNSAAFGMASPLHSKHSLTDHSREVSCNRKLAVLCVEVMSKYNVDKKLGKRIMSDLRF